MRLFQVRRDGGPESPVKGLFIIEIKSLFSIVLLHFGGTREAFHSHAFNALTLWLKGEVVEVVRDHEGQLGQCRWKAGQFKYTPRNLMHKVLPGPGAWALSIRGPWVDRWQEFKNGKTITLTHGRQIVAVE